MQKLETCQITVQSQRFIEPGLNLAYIGQVFAEETILSKLFPIQNVTSYTINVIQAVGAILTFNVPPQHESTRAHRARMVAVTDEAFTSSESSYKPNSCNITYLLGHSFRIQLFSIIQKEKS